MTFSEEQRQFLRVCWRQYGHAYRQAKRQERINAGTYRGKGRPRKTKVPTDQPGTVYSSEETAQQQIA
jgi:hypothetical protein